MGSGDPSRRYMRESEMKMKSLFVMGMVATTLVNNAEAQRRGGNRGGGGSFDPGFGSGSHRNQDLFQIRELQQTYTEYMRASTNLKQLYVELNDITTKLGRNLTKIDELREQRKGAKIALGEKNREITNLTNRVTKLVEQKESLYVQVVTLESEVESIKVEITAEENRIKPFIKAKNQKKKAVDNHQSTFNSAQAEVSTAKSKMASAKSTKDAAEAQAARIRTNLTKLQTKLTAIESNVERLNKQMEPLAQYKDKFEKIAEQQEIVDDRNRKIKKYPWKRSDKRRWKRERDAAQAIINSLERSMPRNAYVRYKQINTQLKVANLTLKKQQSLVNRASTSLATFETQAANAGTAFEVAKIEKQEAETKFEPIKKKHGKLNVALNKAQKKLDEESTQLNILKSNKISKSSSLSSAKSNLNDVENKLTRRENSLIEATAQATQIAADIETFKEKIATRKARIDELDAAKVAMENKELRLFDKLSNSFVRTHNNQVFNVFVGGLDTITPAMQEKMALAAATGAKIMLWGDLTNVDLMSRISSITGVTGSAIIPISEIYGATQSTQNFRLNVRMDAFELNIDTQTTVPVLETADRRVLMSAKIDSQLGVVITSALNPNDINEFDIKALLEMIAYSNVSDYEPVIQTPPPGDNPGDNPGDDQDNGGDYPGDNPGDDQDNGGDYPGHNPGDDQDNGGDYPGDNPGDDQGGEVEVYSTVYKDIDSRSISEVVNGKETLVYKMNVDSEKGFILSNVELSIDASHTYIGDIQIYLTSPSGKEILLRKNQGGRGTSLSDTYSKEIMQAFEGEMIMGTWTLTVIDGYKDRDVGSVDAVRFSIEGERQ